jgi:CheY-like chemotaxis protein
VEKEGWKVVEAENGQVALERLDSEQPRLVLLDLIMPVMDGFEFLQAMRARPQLADVPVVVVTSKDLTADDRRRLYDRVQRVIQKGNYNRSDLVQEIRRLLAPGGSPA